MKDSILGMADEITNNIEKITCFSAIDKPLVNDCSQRHFPDIVKVQPFSLIDDTYKTDKIKLFPRPEGIYYALKRLYKDHK